jgi:glycosyltransferase involved in cell wall biosynthesis
MMAGKHGKAKVLIVGPLPPPFMGPTLATEVILRSSLSDKFRLRHLDTSDHRSTDKLGRIDLVNLLLPIKHYFQLLIAMVTWRPDLVYIPISQTTLGYARDSIFVLVSKLFRTKVLCHLRGGNFRNWYDSASPVTRWFVRRTHSLVDGQIVLGNNLRQLFAGLVDESKVYVVYNGKDVDVQSSQRRPENPIVLFLSNLKRTKGVLRVLDCVPQLATEFPGVEFHFAGDWPEPDVKEEFYAKLSSLPELPVKYLGLLTGQAKSDAFARASIFTLPTNYPAEGQPWAIVEAMAFGLPVISTDHGSINEVVSDKESGCIVDINAPAELEEALRSLLKDPERRLRMGRESRETYERKFTEKTMTGSLGEAIESVILGQH